MLLPEAACPTPLSILDKAKGCGWQGSGLVTITLLITKVSLTVKCASTPGLETGFGGERNCANRKQGEEREGKGVI